MLVVFAAALLLAAGVCELPYDLNTVETVRGSVLGLTDLSQTAESPNQETCIVLELVTASGLLKVQLGPATYLNREEIVIRPGEPIEVTGSRVEIDGKPVLLASQIRRGSQVIELRDDTGAPAWSQ